MSASEVSTDASARHFKSLVGISSSEASEEVLGPGLRWRGLGLPRVRALVRQPRDLRGPGGERRWPLDAASGATLALGGVAEAEGLPGRQRAHQRPSQVARLGKGRC